MNTLLVHPLLDVEPLKQPRPLASFLYYYPEHLEASSELNKRDAEKWNGDLGSALTDVRSLKNEQRAGAYNGLMEVSKIRQDELCQIESNMNYLLEGPRSFSNSLHSRRTPPRLEDKVEMLKILLQPNLSSKIITPDKLESPLQYQSQELLKDVIEQFRDALQVESKDPEHLSKLLKAVFDILDHAQETHDFIAIQRERLSIFQATLEFDQILSPGASPQIANDLIRKTF